MSRSAPSPATDLTRGRRRMPHQRWIPGDVLLIVVFAVAGRSSHERGITVTGVLETAWPFLAAYAVAVLVLLTPRAPSTLLRTGVVLWLSTVVGGLLLRALSGAGVALSFQIVTLLVLGVLLLLPRVLVSAVSRRRAG